jgi:hypothetical protein
LLLLREQVVAPGDRRPQRLLSLGRVSGPARENWEPLLQASEQGIGRQDLDARRSQLDGERQAVEAAADLGHGPVGRKIGADGPCALVEERHRVVLGQWRDRILLLQGQVERLATGGDELEVARGSGQLGKARRAVEHLFDVVQ